MIKYDFSNKRVLVTGGTRGIGNAVVNAFNEASAHVAVNGRTDKFVDAMLDAMHENERLYAAPGDVGTVAGCAHQKAIS
jgi:NAD(P)-dependent dehydrogenase (short-subunit alcohol dehydrogenase family)